MSASLIKSLEALNVYQVTPTTTLDTIDLWFPTAGNFVFWAVMADNVSGPRTMTFSDNLAWGDSAFVRISDTVFSLPGLDVEYTYGYVKNLPSGGSQSVHIDFTGGVIAFATLLLCEFEGIDQTTPFVTGELAVAKQDSPGSGIDAISSGLITNLGLSFQPSIKVAFCQNWSAMFPGSTDGMPTVGTGYANVIDDGFPFFEGFWRWDPTLTTSGAKNTARLGIGRATDKNQIKGTFTAAPSHDTDSYVTFVAAFREDTPGPATTPQPQLMFQMP